jgi:hypothetical protein
MCKGKWSEERMHIYELSVTLISFTNFNAQFLYPLTICMSHYDPRRVLSINMPIFRRTNCVITASGIVTLCERLYSMPDESRMLCSLLSKTEFIGMFHLDTNQLQWFTSYFHVTEK